MRRVGILSHSFRYSASWHRRGREIKTEFAQTARNGRIHAINTGAGRMRLYLIEPVAESAALVRHGALGCAQAIESQSSIHKQEQARRIGDVVHLDSSLIKFSRLAAQSHRRSLVVAIPHFPNPNIFFRDGGFRSYSPATTMEAAHRTRLAKGEVDLGEREAVPTLSGFKARFIDETKVRRKDLARREMARYRSRTHHRVAFRRE